MSQSDGPCSETDLLSVKVLYAGKFPLRLSIPVSRTGAPLIGAASLLRQIQSRFEAPGDCVLTFCDDEGSWLFHVSAGADGGA